MRNHPRIWTAGLAGITLIAALALFLSPTFREPSVARSHVAAPVAVQQNAAQPLHIAPADVLGTGTPWAPLTGDGSN
jgi:hypothetical protein